MRDMTSKAVRRRFVPVAAPRRPGRPPGPNQSERLRQRLIEEGGRLYAEGGYGGLTFASVAARTGVTKATVFHYFANKEALVGAVFESLGRRLEESTAGLFDPPPAPHAARLQRVVGSLVEFYGRDPLNARILGHGLLETDRLTPRPGARGRTSTIFAPFIRRFAEFVERGIAAGELIADRPMATIMTIGGIVLFELMLPSRGRDFTGDVPIEERKREIVAVVERAVVRPGARLSQRTRSPRRSSR
jgi:AcrR family transcriptional regulator